RPKKERGQPPKGTTFSIRLSGEQRDRLTEAAALRGWTPSTFIRNAALERAANILNTSRVTKVDFKRLAMRIADRLYDNPKITITGDGPNEFSATACDGDSLGNVLDDQRLQGLRLFVDTFDVDLESLSNAARLGGSEFLNLIVDFGQHLVAQAPEPGLEPID